VDICAGVGGLTGPVPAPVEADGADGADGADAVVDDCADVVGPVPDTVGVGEAAAADGSVLFMLSAVFIARAGISAAGLPDGGEVAVFPVMPAATGLLAAVVVAPAPLGWGAEEAGVGVIVAPALVAPVEAEAVFVVAGFAVAPDVPPPGGVAGFVVAASAGLAFADVAPAAGAGFFAPPVAPVTDVFAACAFAASDAGSLRGVSPCCARLSLLLDIMLSLLPLLGHLFRR